MDDKAGEYVVCAECKRSQAIVAGNEEGGITLVEAQFIGWERQPCGNWLCPVCCKAADDYAQKHGSEL